MKLCLLAAVCCSIFSLVGCAQNAEDKTANDDSAIVNGEATLGDRAVVAIFVRKEGADGGRLCTATLIAPTVLLTGGRCLLPAHPGDVLSYKAYTGHDLTDSKHLSPTIDITEVHWDPAMNPYQLRQGHDFGIAILAKPLEGVQPIAVNRKPLGALESVRMVGYGVEDGYYQTGRGIRRTAQVPVVRMDAQFIVNGTADVTMCNGDTGGPIFATIDGVEQVVGVNSFGMISCMGEGWSGRVDANLGFLAQYLP